MDRHTGILPGGKENCQEVGGMSEHLNREEWRRGTMASRLQHIHEYLSKQARRYYDDDPERYSLYAWYWAGLQALEKYEVYLLKLQKQEHNRRKAVRILNKAYRYLSLNQWVDSQWYALGAETVAYWLGSQHLNNENKKQRRFKRSELGCVFLQKLSTLKAQISVTH